MTTFHDSDIEVHLAPLNPTNSGQSTHWVCDCPFCGKLQHLYVQKSTTRVNSRGQNTSHFWQCKKCESSGRMSSLLRKLGIELQFTRTRSALLNDKKISNNISRSEPVIHVAQPISIPQQFIGVDYHPYLQLRRWTPTIYDLYRPQIDISQPDRVFFVIENYGQPRAYLGRSIYSKDQINNLNTKGGGRKYLRYQNSVSEFALIIGNWDRVNNDTHTIIVVEGIFDAASVDLWIDSHHIQNTVPVYTFGKKISSNTLNTFRASSVPNFIFFCDPDAIDQLYSNANPLWLHKNVEACCAQGDRDPGDLFPEEIQKVVDSRQNIFEFCRNNKLINKH